MGWLTISVGLLFGGLAALAVLLSWWMRSLGNARTLRSLEDLPTDCRIVVLGCPVRSRSGGPNRYFTARIATAAAAYHEAKRQAMESGRVPPRVLCSGWNEAGEATAMVEALVQANVPPDRIELDPKALRTLDSIDFLAASGPSVCWVLVSQAFHLPRALFLARKRGVVAWGLPAEGSLRGLRDPAREGLARLRAVFDAGRWPRAPAVEARPPMPVASSKNPPNSRHEDGPH